MIHLVLLWQMSWVRNTLIDQSLLATCYSHLIKSKDLKYIKNLNNSSGTFHCEMNLCIVTKNAIWIFHISKVSISLVKNFGKENFGSCWDLGWEFCLCQFFKSIINLGLQIHSHLFIHYTHTHKLWKLWKSICKFIKVKNIV